MTYPSVTCPNCKASISPHTSQCPSCFHSVTPQPIAPSTHASQTSFLKADSENTLFSTPYFPQSESSDFLTDRSQEKKSAPKQKPFSTQTSYQETAGDSQVQEKTDFWTIVLLVLGGNLFTLGILQFFFAENGVVKLEVSGSYWFLFLVVSAVMLYFGLSKSKELK